MADTAMCILERFLAGSTKEPAGPSVEDTSREVSHDTCSPHQRLQR